MTMCRVLRHIYLDSAFIITLKSALVISCLVGMSTGQVKPTIGVEQFMLFNRCRPISLGVKSLSEDAAKIDLRRYDIQSAAETRLRSARLYNIEAEPNVLHPYLYINVNVTGSAFSVEVQYKRWLEDMTNGTMGFAATWQSGSTGTHSGDSSYIMLIVLKHIDRFLAGYLRVNEAHCGFSPILGEHTIKHRDHAKSSD